MQPRIGLWDLRKRFGTKKLKKVVHSFVQLFFSRLTLLFFSVVESCCCCSVVEGCCCSVVGWLLFFSCGEAVVYEQWCCCHSEVLFNSEVFVK